MSAPSVTTITRRPGQLLVPWARRYPGAVPTVAVLTFGLALGAATASPSSVRVAVTLSTALAVVVAVLRSPRQAVIGLLVWLYVLGTLRRILTGLGSPGDNDPLLLMAPAVVAVLVIVAARNGAFRSRTRLTNAVLALSGLLLAGSLNPLQGGVAVGFAGLLFVLVPALWFWVGRSLLDDRTFARILWLVSVLAPLAALYGLYQVYRGFPPWDANWIEDRGYAALQVGDALRQFASFSSATEYVGFIAIGMVIWALRLRHRSTRALAIVPLALISWGLALASVRGALVVLAVTLGMLFAIARGLGLLRTVMVGVGALFLLGFAVSQIDPGQVGGGRTSALLSRQVTGLSDPLDPGTSTLPIHIDALVGGLREVAVNPLGRGTGSASIAADRFGDVSQITDVDPSNVAVALGLPGLVAYLAIVILGLRLALRRARSGRDFLGLVALGILLVTSLQWLAGGNYAIAPLPWLVLGWLDRQSIPSKAAVSRGGVPVEQAPEGTLRSGTVAPVGLEPLVNGSRADG